MAYRTIWETTVTHEGLGKYRHIRGSDQNVVAMKALHQQQQWEEQWQRKLETERRAQEKARLAQRKIQERDQTAQEKARQKAEREQYLADRKQEAAECDTAAKALLNTIKNTLNHTLDVNDAVDWDTLKDKSKFSVPMPSLQLPSKPQVKQIHVFNPPFAPRPKPEYIKKPASPDKFNPKYQPTFTFFDRLISSMKAKKIAASELFYRNDREAWEAKCSQIDSLNSAALKLWEDHCKEIEVKNAAARIEWEKEIASLKHENMWIERHWEEDCQKAKCKHEGEIKLWEDSKRKFLEAQQEANTAIDQNRLNYFDKDPGAIIDYCDTVLSNSQYPDFFPKEWELDFNAESKILVVDYILPAPEDLPTLKEVQYIQSRDELKESHLSEKEREALYDGLLYQVTLRTIHELFEADVAEALHAIAFNGIVTALDKSTGHNITSCVMSVMAQKDTFLQINLANIEPKACFKSLKGVSAPKLAGITAVPPVMAIDKEDRRIVASYGVLENVNEGTNLATMDWEDFEHLIREVFEKEFSVNGGEVKVTQASRDGGVDAIAFDPDPIRGGKIVIQAKRYTNVVGVSAVRDLYGTVINEGATKGILVTTASYGPDAYEFSKGKPLSLLTGGNLLHLLEKHGQQAYININEAKLAQNKMGA